VAAGSGQVHSEGAKSVHCGQKTGGNEINRLRIQIHEALGIGRP
jgi:hypothetical protein